MKFKLTEKHSWLIWSVIILACIMLGGCASNFKPSDLTSCGSYVDVASAQCDADRAAFNKKRDEMLADLKERKAAREFKVEQAKREAALKELREEHTKEKQERYESWIKVYNIDFTYSEYDVKRTFANAGQFCSTNTTSLASGSTHVQLACSTPYYKDFYYYFTNGKMTSMQN